MICDNLDASSSQTEPDSIVVDSGAHYNMESSQKLPMHIPTFLQWHNDDPAVKVRRLTVFCLCFLTSLVQNFLSKWRSHLLPHIQATLSWQATDALHGPTCVTSAPNPVSPIVLDETSCNFIFFKSDCIYHHKLLQVNFTTYNVWCGTDIIRSEMIHCNIMLLADHMDSSVPTSHRFCMHRSLGHTMQT